jgi:hypothetical protein
LRCRSCHRMEFRVDLIGSRRELFFMRRPASLGLKCRGRWV